MIGSPLPLLLCKVAKKSTFLSYDGDEFSFKNFISFMVMQNEEDREQQDKELEMHRLELNTQSKENRAQHQMLQMMMATLITHQSKFIHWTEY